MECRDMIKLIASTGPFDARLMEQPEQDGPRLITRGAVAARPSLSGTLSRLMARLQTRSLGSEPDDSSQTLDDFVTYAVAITTVRPCDQRTISSAAPADLGNGVVIDPHPALQAEARLTTISEVSRDLGNLVMQIG